MVKNDHIYPSKNYFFQKTTEKSGKMLGGQGKVREVYFRKCVDTLMTLPKLTSPRKVCFGGTFGEVKRTNLNRENCVLQALLGSVRVAKRRIFLWVN